MARGDSAAPAAVVVRADEKKEKAAPVVKEKKEKKEKAEKVAVIAGTGITVEQQAEILALAGGVTETEQSTKWRLQLKKGYTKRTVNGKEYREGAIIELENISDIPKPFRDAWETLEQPAPTVQAVPQVVEYAEGFFIVSGSKILNELPLNEEQAKAMINALANP